jgi:ABC-type uncharacterized transport system substrate-binding protein
MTGVTTFGVGLTAKRLGLLLEMVPMATTMAVLVNPKSVNAQPQVDDAQEASARLGVRLTVLTATAENEFESAFAILARQQAGALWSAPNRCSTAGSNCLSCWQHATGCRQSMSGASSPQPAG